jgi:hypothetical protein
MKSAMRAYKLQEGQNVSLQSGQGKEDETQVSG